MFEDIIKEKKKKEICKFCMSTDIGISENILITDDLFTRHRHLVICYNCNKIYYNTITKLKASNV